MPKSTIEVTRRAKHIKLLLMDVDGVLTDGRFYLVPHPDGSVTEAKVFHSLDGAGLKLLLRAGLRTGIITGRASPAITARGKELEMSFVVQDTFEKLPAYENIKREAGLTDAQIAFVGDDVTDLPVLRRAGLAITVPDAHPEARRVAHYVTRTHGGQGAVREVCDLLLRAQGKYNQVLAPFLKR